MSWMHLGAARSPLPLVSHRRAWLAALLLAFLVSGGSPPQASGSDGERGGDGGNERLRVVGSCGAGATARLELEAKDDGRLEVRFRVRYTQPAARWRVVLVRERRVVWTGSTRTTLNSPSFELRRELQDLPGADQVTVRAWGPRGLTCRASGTLPE